MNLGTYSNSGTYRYEPRIVCLRGAMARLCEHALEKDGDVAPDGWVYPRVFRRKQIYT